MSNKSTIMNIKEMLANYCADEYCKGVHLADSKTFYFWFANTDVPANVSKSNKSLEAKFPKID